MFAQFGRSTDHNKSVEVAPIWRALDIEGDRRFMMKFSKIALGSLAVAGSFLLVSPRASAEDLDVSAVVTSSCVIGTSPVAFGSYDPLTVNASDALEAAGSVTVSCTSGSTAHILLDEGLNAVDANQTAPTRQMADGANVLAYFLFTDEPRSDAWGNTDLTGVDHLGTGATSGPIAVYGSVPGGQNVAAGNYADTVQATVTF
jgi:spore coat protein U-like protein